jgi:hypothetical protein
MNMTQLKYVPRRGTASELAGIDSEIMFRKTMRLKRTVTPRESFSPESGGRVKPKTARNPMSPQVEEVVEALAFNDNSKNEIDVGLIWATRINCFLPLRFHPNQGPLPILNVVAQLCSIFPELNIHCIYTVNPAPKIELAGLGVKGKPGDVYSAA